MWMLLSLKDQFVSLSNNQIEWFWSFGVTIYDLHMGIMMIKVTICSYVNTAWLYCTCGGK